MKYLYSFFFCVCLMGCTTDSTDTGDSRTIFPTPPAITEHQTADALPEQTPLAPSVRMVYHPIGTIQPGFPTAYPSTQCCRLDGSG